jgi:nucleotide-binding universal stress UspA family protein
MRKILVPIDFSEKSEYASKLAAHISRKTGSDIYLLHMIELPSGLIEMGAGSNFSIPESMMYVRKVKDKMLDFKKSFFSNTNGVHHAIKFKNPFEGITEYNKKINADLIIMGSKGISDFDEILIGSNTEKVVRTSKTPVIVVKQDAEKFKIKNLVFASSFNEDNKGIFAKFLDFANHFKSNIHLLKVNTPSKFESTHDIKNRIKNFISGFQLPKHSIHVYSDKSVEKGVMNFSEEIKADLIALSTHGRSGLSHLFNGSVTKNLSKSALRPLITFKI